MLGERKEYIDTQLVILNLDFSTEDKIKKTMRNVKKLCKKNITNKAFGAEINKMKDS